MTFFVKLHVTNNLQCCAVRQVKDEYIEAATSGHTAKHIVRVEAAMRRYSIKNTRFIFKMDQATRLEELLPHL